VGEEGARQAPLLWKGVNYHPGCRCPLDRFVDDLTVDYFQQLQYSMAKRWGSARLANQIQPVRRCVSEHRQHSDSFLEFVDEMT